MAKRILFLTPQLPYPPQQGTAIRNYNLMAQAAARNEVHLLSFSDNKPKQEQLSALGNICATVRTVPTPGRTLAQRLWAALFSPLPDLALRLQSSAFERELDQALVTIKPDLLQVEGLEMTTAVGGRAPAGDFPSLVFDAHNAEYLLQKRMCLADAAHLSRWPMALYSFLQWRKLSRYEGRMCRRAEHVLACSPSDASALRRICPGLAPLVVPNGVDCEAYRPGVVRPLDLGRQALVFTGKMDFRPNVDAVLWFVNSVLPLIRLRAPESTVYVVGKNPHPRLEPLRGIAGVTLTGYVEDVRPFIEGASVYVVPLQTGGGTRLKVLEAMAMGKALVTTTLGGEGIDAQPGKHWMVADEADAFASQVLALLADRSCATGLGLAAREFAVSRFDWRIVTRPLVALYDS